MNKKKLVVLTGAGISAESGLKTFRDMDGYWENYRIEEVASPEGFAKHPELVLEFYNLRRAQLKTVTPNAAHQTLVDLEDDFDVQIITQNVDDLHERAGSKNIYHLHGELLTRRSSKNESIKTYWADDMSIEHMAPDGSMWRTDIVWFGEPVPMVDKVIPIVMEADIFVVIGTSLQVYPAAGLLDLIAPGTPIIVLDNAAPFVSGNVYTINEPATAGVNQLKARLALLK